MLQREKVRQWIWKCKLKIGASSVFEDFGISGVVTINKYIILFKLMIE